MARDYKQVYEGWLSGAAFDAGTKAELSAIAGDEKEIEDRFYRDLEFGTAGLRGVLGAGTNRMNRYTVSAATQGLANFILKQGDTGLKERGVVIAHDSRRMSPEFAEVAALVLNGCGIRAYLFDGLRPTPELSFAVRELGCIAGIVITASHNPPEYNGYKVYWEDGAQIPYPTDEQIIAEVALVTDYAGIKTMDKQAALQCGLLRILDAGMDDKYVQNVLAQRVRPEIAKEVGDRFKAVYTPLHGTGNVPVRRALAEAGFGHILVVPEQEKPDGEFPTVGYPNPEDKKAFALAIALAEKEGADIAIATDPDADRVGVAVAHNGGFVFLTGNQSGALLAEYILAGRKEKGTLPGRPAVVSTIVSTDMTRAIAARHGASYYEVLTGFKYIGGVIKRLEEEGGKEQYVFGFEESYGCLAGTYARDKDAVVASLLLCEMAAYYKSKGRTLVDALDELYAAYGHHRETTVSITLKGIDGAADIRRIMKRLRDQPPSYIHGAAVEEFRDYAAGTVLRAGQASGTGLPKADVLYFQLADGGWVCVRPSGTEPKVKLYVGVKAETAEAAEEKLKALGESAGEMVK